MGIFDNNRSSYDNQGSTDNSDMYASIKRDQKSTLIVFAVIIIAFLIYSLVGKGGVTTTGRTALDSSKCNLLNLWYNTTSDYTSTAVSDQMISFYEASGVEPFIVINTDDTIYTVDELNALAKDYYENELFKSDESKKDEGHMVIVFQPKDTSGNIGIYVGTDAATVIDDDAVGTFRTDFSECYNKYTGTDIFSNTFKQASSDIMGRSKNLVYIIIALAVICVVYFVFNYYKISKRRQQEKNNANGGNNQ